MTTEQASQWLRFFQRRFTLLLDREDLLVHWHALVQTLGVTGLKSHDARLVAAMQSYGIGRLLTFNVKNFTGFSITLVDPALV
jgi:predicted nucleic acid-binding protein